MVQAILFDSDGVLVDTERLFFEATRDAFAAEGAVIAPEQWAARYLAESRSSLEIGASLGIAPSRLEKTLERRDRAFWAKLETEAFVFPDVEAILRQLSGQFRLAIVTGSHRERLERVHKTTGLLDFFELIVARDDCDKPKPDPECYLKASRQLSLKPQDCLAVEDSPRGAVAAVAAGTRCALIPTPLTALALCPSQCRILNSFAELPALTQREEHIR